MNLGVKQVREGDFEAAVFSLDSVVRKLSAPNAKGRDELAWAYAYLGVAYVGLDHQRAAKGKFREALALESSLRLGAGEFPPKVLRLFDEVVIERTAVKKRKGAKIALIVGGVGAASAVGIAVAVSGGKPANRVPTASIGMTPSDGDAILDVTEVSFTASSADPDFDVLSFLWDFGDGASASGSTVTHKYAKEGRFTCSLTVSDGRGGIVRPSATVNVQSLSGAWRDDSTSDWVDNAWVKYEYQLTQSGATLQGQSYRPRASSTIEAALVSPRRVRIRLTERGSVSLPECVGEVSEALSRIDCTQGARSLRLLRLK